MTAEATCFKNAPTWTSTFYSTPSKETRKGLDDKFYPCNGTKLTKPCFENVKSCNEIHVYHKDMGMPSLHTLPGLS